MEPQLQLLGPIVRLQIQTAALKIGAKPREAYDPAALLAVDTLTLTEAGAEAHWPDGERVLDIHNRHHPATRQFEGENALSVGFTAHYDLMREHFGGPVTLGCAGENVIVAVERRIPLEQVARGLVIHGAGRPAPARLHRIMAAAPCRPFTRYLLRAEADDEAASLKAGLQFLGGGMRGFYAALAGAEPVTVRAGDLVFAPVF